uniref:Transcription elongation factor TFIIS n=1 Tax=Rhinella marina erythrocytic-like virus TaxID=2859906 RepID=A0A8F6YJT7_9VIRU|nr:transcription elongation factor TFIIS [Rhinella marina erythrocytic-like virus]
MDQEFIGYFSKPIFDRVRLIEETADKHTKASTFLEEGVIQCGKCKSKRVFTTSKQVRAADEPMTVFCYCVGCKSKWTE